MKGQDDISTVNLQRVMYEVDRRKVPRFGPGLWSGPPNR